MIVNSASIYSLQGFSKPYFLNILEDKLDNNIFKTFESFFKYYINNVQIHGYIFEHMHYDSYRESFVVFIKSPNNITYSIFLSLINADTSITNEKLQSLHGILERKYKISKLLK